MRAIVAAVVAVAVGPGGCASSVAPDPGLEGLGLKQVAPATIVPGTKVLVKGDSFVDTQWGAGTLHLTGQASGQSVDVSWPTTFVDFTTMNVAIDASNIQELGGNVDFHGTAVVEFVATSDNHTYTSDPLTLDLSFRSTLTPSVAAVPDANSVIFVNNQTEVDGDGFLLGGNEGSTVARISGCFQPDSSSVCTNITTQDVVMQPMVDFSRNKAAFPFLPKLTGIQPGTFTGQIQIVNKPAGGAEIAAPPVQTTFTLVTSQVFSVDPPAASLGQYVFVHGGGFVGGEAGAVTELQLVGTFNKTGGPPVQVTMDLIPDFVEGPLVRYVLNETDSLGHALDLHTETGHFSGTLTPIIQYNNDTVTGIGLDVTLDLAPVKQVIYLNFESAYVEELRDFGLRAVDQQIRDRILEVCKRSYKGINIEFRTDPVTDFALFSNVDLVGVDPNSMGLFGYDNTPGKDTNNLRLDDHIGGVNAATLESGEPGFGGVFLRSMMAFSEHPGQFAQSAPGADPVFDKLFDPFRSDRGGKPITSADLTQGVAVLADGTSCPAHDRAGQLACGVFVMGNMVGGTLSHEIGHSLGLAYPFGDPMDVHDHGDEPNRLMDIGIDRPFLERAEILGQGPGVFCDDEYNYLRQIMPANTPPDNIMRPGCD
jgi:hypothetical protein